MNKLSPNLMVKNVADTVAYYREVLGFSLVMAVPESKDAILTEIPTDRNVVYALVKNGTVELMFQEEFSLKEDVTALNNHPIGSSTTLYIEVDSVNDIYSNIKGKADIVKEKAVAWYGMEEVYIRDPNGYIICFASRATA